MNILKLSLLSIILFLTSVGAAAQTRRNADRRFAEQLRSFETFVRQQMKADRTVGITIGFFKDDFTWVKAFGFSDLENNIPMKRESAFRIASISKPMTAIAVLQLVEQGKINLDDEIQKYVPYFPRKKYPMTVRELLGHVAGMRHYNDDEIFIRERKSTREAVDLFSGGDLIAEPDTRFNYSGPGYALLGAAIENVSGKSYADYMRENVWSALGMNDTRLDDPAELIPNRVRGYQLVNGKIKNSEYIDTSTRFASGGTRSTVIDLLKFARGICDGKLLSPKTYELMWTPMTLKNGRFTTYGMGWWTDSTNGRLMVWHGGYLMETQAALLIFPRQNFAIAALMNFEGAVPYPYTDQLHELILDEPIRTNIYAGDKEDRLLLNGMTEAFNYGMRHFDQYRKPVTAENKELARSFAYFNAIPALPPDESAERISQGRHPHAGESFVKMTSFMAARLHAADPKRFDDYVRRGAIALFADYINLYRKDPSIPADLKFTAEFEKRVAAWNVDWARTWTDETRRIELSTATDFRKLGRLLSPIFNGHAVYPNFAPKLEALTDSFVASGNVTQAVEAATLSARLYPNTSGPLLELGLAYSLAGDKEGARRVLRDAKELDANEVSLSVLNRFADFLVAQEKLNASMLFLEVAIELYPNSADLYHALAEVAQKLGQKDKAINSYEKALTIDPNYSNAAAARSALKELKQQ